MNPVRLTHTTAFRLALRYTGFVCLLTIVCFAIIYWVTISQLKTQINAGLRAESAALTRLYELKGINGLRATIAALSTTKSLAESNTGDAGPRQYLLTDAGLHPLAGSLPEWPPGIPSQNTAWTTLRLPAPSGQPGLDAVDHRFEMRSVALTLPGGYHLLVGQTLDELIELRNTILALTLAAIVLVLIAGFLGGALVSRGVLRRLQDVTHTADTIMAGNLSGRIPEEHGNDEFDALAAKLNAMLERIEQLMQATREVTENVAHDLRGPLTRLRGRAEMALMKSADVQNQREALQKAIEETDQIVATLNAILSIAQIESGPRRDWRAVDLSTVCHDLRELYEPLAEQKSIRFVSAIVSGVQITGNPQLIAQAISNLLGNAIKYTPAGGQVQLALERNARGSAVTVIDNGPGIPAELRSKALERFVRLDASRSTPGNGLGLSLVKAIAERHGAELTLADNTPGLRVALQFRQ
ncbi:MAG: sensor histidine kinase [Gammaproteobacteria bacterium]